MGKPWMLLGVLTIGIVPVGCATIGHTEPVVSERPVKTLREVVHVQRWDHHGCIAGLGGVELPCSWGWQ